MTIGERMGERIRAARIKRDMTQKCLADRLGVKHNSISNWEKGRNHPDMENFFQICDILDVDPNDLFSVDYDEKEMGLLSQYRALGERGKQRILLLMGFEYSLVKNRLDESGNRRPKKVIRQKQEHIETSYRRQIPLYHYYASAGKGAFTDENSRYDLIELPLNTETGQATFAVPVRGDSMEPQYCDGDIVLVRQQPYIEHGEIGIFVLNGEGYIKLYTADGLESINPSYPTIKVTDMDQIQVSGKVLGKCDQRYQIVNLRTS